MTWRILSVLALLAAVTYAAEKDWRFDMGTPDSPVLKGFLKVTPKTAYTPERGYGWVGRRAPKATRRDIPEPLGCDFCLGRATFQVDVPPGDYVVWTLLGDSGHGINPPLFWRVPYTIKVDRKPVVSVKQSPETLYSQYWFRNLYRDYRPGESLWEKYFAQFDRPHTFEVSAPEGRIRITFSHYVPIDAVWVFPASAAGGVDAAVAELREQRKRLFDASFRRVPPEGEIPEAPKTEREEAKAAAPTERVKRDRGAADLRGPTAAERRRGYVLFQLPFGDPVYPDTRPGEGDALEALATFAAPGEYEPLTFCVWPLRDLKDVTVTVSPLRSGTGATLPPEAVTVSLVKYIEKRKAKGLYAVVPRTLLPGGKADLCRDVCKRYWLTLRAPETQAPGEYRGTVTLKAQGAPATRVPVRFRVLPFKLDAPGIAYGMYYYTPDKSTYRPVGRAPKAGRPLSWGNEQALKLAEIDFRDQAAHGMNCAAIAPQWYLFRAKGGPLKVDEALWGWQSRFLNLYARSPLDRPAPFYGANILGIGLPGFRWSRKWKVGDKFSPEYERLFTEAVRVFYQRAHAAKAKGEWPEVIFYASDELSNHRDDGVAYGVSLLKLLGRIREKTPGGFRLCSSMNGPQEAAMLPYLDIAIVNNGWPVAPGGIAKIKKAGCAFWTYNIGFWRFTWGYYLLRIGAVGRLQWHYRCNPRGTCDPNNWLTSSSYAMVDTGPDRVLPSRQWEMMREGVDDARYVRTLRNRIGRAMRSGKPRAVAAAKRAKARLDWVLEHIHPTLSVYITELGFWDAEAYMVLRKRLADDIIRIEEAMR